MMPTLDLATIAGLLGAAGQGSDAVPAGLAIDSRRVQPGDLFVALRGERVDGHDYIAAAAGAGAMAALVERDVVADIPCLRVENTERAITVLGAANREAYGGEVVAITGSCGKTTVKNLCRAIFSACAPTVATAGNYNNELGVPLTLSRLSAGTQYAVIEMGAAGRGHIAHLCSLARPRVSTVLNAMEAHLDGFGTVADVADIKAEIFDGLDAAGIGAVNLDQSFSGQWQQRVKAAGAAVLTYSCESEADVCASDIADHGLAGTSFTLAVNGERVAVELPLPGRHNVANAVAAAALAAACDLPADAIAGGLARVEGEPGRMATETLADGTLLIDDSYNANPGSVRAAIALLGASAGRRGLVLGEMLELGGDSERYHREMGELAAAAGLELFWGVGPALAPAVEAFGPGARLFGDRDAAGAAAPELLREVDMVLVKGSRGAAMEAVIGALRAAARENT